MQDLSAPLSQVARTIAGRLGRRGHRAWIVGGVVRDLALARATHDLDLTSSATPGVIEAEFERTVPLGRSFGTVLIHLDGQDVEHTTFRSETGYSDARRPDAVEFGRTPEEDAKRRDFTCNALYLDPLEGTLLDPTGGMRDLEARRIACVGDAARRFGEDGLRIVRLARFAGQLALEPTAETRAAASDSLAALRGVSPERVRVEIERLLERGGIVRAMQVLSETRALPVVLPGLGTDADSLARGLELFAHLPDPPGGRLGLAALLRPAIGSSAVLEESLARLEGLKPSRAVRDHVADTWRLEQELFSNAVPSRATRVRWMRRPAFDDALRLATARARSLAGGGEEFRRLRDLAEESERVRALEREAPFVTSADLVARGSKPGPAFGAILREAETLQLDGLLATRDAALHWLDARLADRSGA